VNGKFNTKPSNQQPDILEFLLIKLLDHWVGSEALWVEPAPVGEKSITVNKS
jgi:hypothetical protein